MKKGAVSVFFSQRRRVVNEVAVVVIVFVDFDEKAISCATKVFRNSEWFEVEDYKTALWVPTGQ